MENKTSKYFKYAIGEILLVVIGILIALQINNWNENVKEDLILRSHLATLQENIKNDSLQLVSLIDKRNLSINETTVLIDRYKRGDSIESTRFVRTLLNIVIEQKFESDIKDFESLKALKAFEHENLKSLRDLITNYNEMIEDVRFLELRQNTFTENMESHLWRNGFFDKTWQYFRSNVDSLKFQKPNFRMDPLSLIGEYEEIKGLLMRNEFVMNSALKKYDLLMEKGTLLNHAISNYLTHKNPSTR